MSSSVQDVLSSDEEIEEEIINDDLKCLGVKEDLKNMDLQEKKNLLSAIKQSASPGHADTAHVKSEAVNPKNMAETTNKDTTSSPSNLLLSKTDFPELATPVSSKRGFNTLRTPKSMSSTVWDTQKLSVTSPDISKPHPFCLPFCIDDMCPPLLIPKKDVLLKKNVYHRMQSETNADAVERMLNQHDEWKKKLEEMLTLQKLSSLDIIDTQNKQKNGEAERTPNRQSLMSTPVDGKENDTLVIKECSSGNSSKRWISTAENSSTKTKTWNERENRRQRSNKKRGKIVEQGTSSAQNVEFDFTEKWSPQTGTWTSPSASKTKNVYKRQIASTGDTPRVEAEKKVQCPICQVHFLQSKVENHAAECEGFVSEPTQGINTDQDTRVAKHDKAQNEVQEVCDEEDIGQNSATKRAFDIGDDDNHEDIPSKRLLIELD